MGRVRKSQGVLKAPSEQLKSEPELIAGLAEAYFKGGHAVDWKALGADYSRIREMIDKVAKGFKGTESRATGVGYYLPNNVRERNFSKLPGGKARITINKLPEHRLEADEFMLMTIRSHDQFNTTIYGMDDRYRGVYNERRIVLMNPQDMVQKSLEKMEVVNLSSIYDHKTRIAYNFKVLPYKIPRGNLAAYFPETNVLVPYDQFADRSRTPISKSIKVRVMKTASRDN
jgi:anaerobic selenocysteine-containing dehydrogenase